MAIDYLSYQQAVKSPLEMALAGYQSGLDIRQAQAQKAQAAQMQADLATLAQNPQANARDYASMMMKYPQMSEHFKQTFDLLNGEQQRVKQSQALNLFSAIDAGQIDVAERLLEQQKAAAENSGLYQDAQSADALLQLVRANPQAAKTSAGLLLSSTMGPDKFAETWTKLQSEQRERELLPGQVQKQAADLGLTQAQTRQALAGVGKTNAETQKLILEMEAAKSGKGGPVDPAKRFDLETKLRGEYSKETKNFNDVQEAYRRIGAAQDTAAGDLGLIFSYMKILDPGSVVREGEFATAQNAAGVPERVVNIYNNLLSGERLNPGQRKSFRAQAGGLFNAARQREQEVRSGLTRVANNYGLNTDNVFLAESPATVPTTGAEQPSYMKYSTGGQ